MPLDPAADPKACLTMLLAAFIYVLAFDRNPDINLAFEEAEKFIEEAENRYGKITP